MYFCISVNYFDETYSLLFQMSASFLTMEVVMSHGSV